LKTPNIKTKIITVITAIIKKNSESFFKPNIRQFLPQPPPPPLLGIAVVDTGIVVVNPTLNVLTSKVLLFVELQPTLCPPIDHVFDEDRFCILPVPCWTNAHPAAEMLCHIFVVVDSASDHAVMFMPCGRVKLVPLTKI
jgi:hypothetical protein